MLHSLRHRHTAEADRHTAEAHRETARRDTAGAPQAEHPVAVAGRQFVRYALVVVITSIGALKYSSYEATAIHPLIANSPIMSWFYSILGVRSLAATLGTVEVIAALLIALRFVSPRLSAAARWPYCCSWAR